MIHYPYNYPRKLGSNSPRLVPPPRIETRKFGEQGGSIAFDGIAEITSNNEFALFAPGEKGEFYMITNVKK